MPAKRKPEEEYQIENLTAMPSWKFRRRAVFGSLLFAAGVIVYVAWQWDDTGIAETLALGGFGLIGAIVAAYIGGATYQDVKLWKPVSLEDKAEYKSRKTKGLEDIVEEGLLSDK